MKGIALLFFISSLFNYWPVKAQNVQWATHVVEFSSQYSEDEFSANQALGLPDAMDVASFYEMAWAPSREQNITNEYLVVGFENPMRIQQVAIAESFNPGAIFRITLYFTDGEQERIFENKFPRQVLAPVRLFRYNFPMSDRAVEAVKIELKTKSVNGYNQIDGIAISDSEQPIEIHQASASSTSIPEAAEKLGTAINSLSSERMPIISPDGRALYFARKDHAQNIGEKNNDDIWVSYLNINGSWSEAVNIGAPLNNKDHNFVVSVSPSNDVLYLANEYDSDGGDGVSVTRRVGRRWSRPEALQIENHYNLSAFVNYHLNIDGTILLMAVERNDGLGDMDIFVTFQKKDGTWSKPKNLGSTINTPEVESSVFLAADEKTIYFSSNGHGGEGGLDMFMSQRLDDSWTTWTIPQNMGSGINSSKNDYNYTIPASGEYAYFAADNDKGNSDIYRIRIPERFLPNPVAILSGKVIDAVTGQPISAKLKLRHLNSDRESEVESKPNGEYMLVLPSGVNVSLFAERNGYFSVSESMAFTGQYLEEEDTDSKIVSPELTSKGQSFADVEELRFQLNALTKELNQFNETRNANLNIQLSLKEQVNGTTFETLRQQYNDAVRKSSKKQSTTREGKNEDDELTAMKQKFNKHNNDGEVTQSKGNTARKKPTSKSEDAELEAMKRKFNKHNKRNPNKGKDGEEYLDMEIGAGETIGKANADPADFGFAQLKQEAWMDVEKESLNRAQLVLKKELLNEVAKELEIKWALSTLTRIKFRQYVADLEKEIKKAIKNNPSNPYNHIDRGTEMGSVEYELRKQIESEIQNTIKTKWRDAVKQQLKAELAYRYKKDQETGLRKDLLNKQKKALKVEKKTIQKSSKNTALREKGDLVKKKAVEYQEINKDILLLPIKRGTLIPMNNVFFEANAATIKSESNVELDRVLEFLKRNSSVSVQVRGHTNGWCSTTFANQLSMERALVVAQYFTDNGIPKDRIEFRGYGKTIPVATNDTLEGRKQNQRVELKILEVE